MARTPIGRNGQKHPCVKDLNPSLRELLRLGRLTKRRRALQSHRNYPMMPAFRCPPDLVGQITARRDAEDRTHSNFMRRVLRRYLLTKLEAN